MPDRQPLTELLACFVAGTPSDAIPKGAFAPAKNVILDTLGVALAASARPIGKIIVRHVAENAGASGCGSRGFIKRVGSME